MRRRNKRRSRKSRKLRREFPRNRPKGRNSLKKGRLCVRQKTMKRIILKTTQIHNKRTTKVIKKRKKRFKTRWTQSKMRNKITVLKMRKIKIQMRRKRVKMSNRRAVRNKRLHPWLKSPSKRKSRRKVTPKSRKNRPMMTRHSL